MQIEGPGQQPLLSEYEVLERVLPLTGARLLELGCGAAEKTRELAERSSVEEIVAAEVDHIQHGKNLTVSIPKVTFKSYGAQRIDEADESFDIVVMFKSLHHVPQPFMKPSLLEIKRVLRPGGLAYISGPVFAGDFNEVLRLFHDESEVRKQAFGTVKAVVEEGVFELVDEIFFLNNVRMTSFDQFAQRVINVTHTQHQLSAELIDEVQCRFLSFEGNDGCVFQTPNRVDLLRKPVG